MVKGSMRSWAARCGSALVAVVPLWAGAAEPGRDHPAVPRYPGAVMKQYDFKEFEEAQLLLSQPREVGGRWVADKLLPVEGAVTYAYYEIPGTASAFQVFRNYQAALQRSGFKELFVCKRPCIDTNLGSLQALLKARNLYLNGHEDVQYLAAQRDGTSVSLAVNASGSGPSGQTWVFLFVIDKGQLDTGKMAVSGSSPIAKALAADGRVDLYGFYFDTGKAQLQPGSEKTAGELAQVLRDNPALKIQVVGHTDNVGQVESNLRLSESRAQAVAEALKGLGIDAARLQALGQGANQPVAPNSSDDGRARNRRVEVIAQAGSTTAASSSTNPTAATGPVAEPARKERKDKASGEDVLRKTQESTDTANRVLETVRSLKDLFGR